MSATPNLSFLYRNATAAIVVAAVLLAAPARPLGQTAASLFDEPARPGPRVAQEATGARRTRQVTARRDAFAALTAPGTDARPDVVLNLFADLPLRIERERLELSPLGHRTWVGHVQGDAESTVTLTWDGATLTGGVVTRDAAYDITTAAGTVVVTERDLTTPERELAAQPARATREAAPLTVGTPAFDAGTAAIDVLVLYTPAAAARAGGVSQMQSQLANAVASTNTAMQRSGVNAMLTAVGIQSLSYTENASGLSQDLYAISGGGTMSAAVEAARNAVGADLVALVTGRSSSAGGCGIAWLGPSSSATYSATEQACLYAGQWSFSHELGHNFGADHAPGDTSPIGVSYAHGYREGTIRTLMAYAVAGSPARLLNYSSATVLETGLATGNSLQDNARRLSETVATVAAYKPPVGGGGSAPAAPTGLAASVVGQAVTLTWTAAPGATSYALQVGRSAGDSSVAAVTTTSPSYAGTLPAGTYFWRVRALNASGASPASAEASFAVAAVSTVPGTPRAFAATVSGRTVTLSWMPAAGGATPTGYEMEVGSAPGAGNVGRFPLAGAPVAFANVPVGTYYARLRALAPGGPSAPTADIVVTVTGACAVPGAPAIAASVAARVVSLSWTTPSGTGPFTYTLGVGSAPGLLDIGIFPMGGLTSYVVAAPPRTYYVKVVASNACGQGAIGNELQVVVP